MPSLTSPKTEVITIEAPFGGWVPQNLSSTVPAAGTSKTLQYSLSKFIDLYRANFTGHIAPGQTLARLSDPGDGSGGNVINQLPVDATSLNGKLWAILANFRVARFTENGIDAFATSFSLPIGSMPSPHSGHAAATPNNDGGIVSVVDQTSSNPNFLVYSWEDATDGDVGLAAYNSSNTLSSNTVAWLSNLTGGGVLTKGVPHKICKGGDGNIYITNGQNMVQIQTQTAHIYSSPTASMTRLSFGAGWTATHAIPYQNFMIVIGYGSVSTDTFGNPVGSGNARIWWWNYGDANPSYVFDLDDYYGDALFADPQGTLYAFTHGKDGLTSLWAYNGSQFQVIYRYVTSSIGSVSPPAGVDTYNKMLTFAAYPSGSTSPTIGQWDGNGFHQTLGYPTDNAAVSAIGFVKNLDGGNKLYIGATYGTPTSGKIYALNGGYSLGAFFDSILYPIPHNGRITAIKPYFSQFGTGSSITFSLYNGYDTATDLLNTTLTYSANGALTEFTIPTYLMMDAFWLKATWSHVSTTAVVPIIRKIEVTIELTDYPL